VQGLSGFLKGVTFLGNTKVAVIEELAAAAAILALTRRLAYLVPMLIVAGAELLHQWLKEAIGRPGPDLLVRPDHNSFPSGHVFHAVVFFGLLTALALPLLPARWMRGTLLCLFVGFVAATMFSRVYLGYHWPSDVLASLLDGWPVLLLAVLVLNRLTRRRPTPTPPAA
jgi:undecaprenyl-diphosphatase